MSTPPAIDLRDLTACVGRTTILRGVTLQVAPGEIHGFLGPNGAGKTTTLRVLLGALRPTAGTARILGQDCWAEATTVHRRIAYVPADVDLWPTLTGGEIIDLLLRLGGKRVTTAQRDAWLERFDLDPRKKARTYSTGNRHKVLLIAAFLSDAEVYLFDEPTSGLDPLKEAEFHRAVRELAAAERTVLLSSHILSEVEALADRISLIRDGRIITTATLAQLHAHTRTHLRADLLGDPHALVGLTALQDVVVDGQQLRATVDRADLTDVLHALVAQGVADLVVQPPTLEDILTGFYTPTGS